MSKGAKFSFLIAFLFLISAFVINLMTGLWLPLNSVLLGAAGLAAVIAILLDYKMYLEFLTMRTTKHGMNMGATILIVLVLIVCVNYLANLHNKSWDVTQEKLNSLSDQSTKLLGELKDDVDIKVFTRGPTAQDEKTKIKQALQLFEDTSSHVKVRYINPYIDGDLAMQYLNDLPDRDTAAAVVFVEHAGKKIRVQAPFDEAAITGALIKATRAGESKIYFIKGHGEKDIEGDGDQSLHELARALGESSFKAESLNLLDKKEIPKDAAVVAIVGPALPYLDAEIKWLHTYVEQGGKLFVALDPGQRQNLAGLLKDLGIEFENNYVLTLMPIQGGGPALILGRSFDGTSEITKSFPASSSYALFYLASEVKPAPDKPASIQTHELVKTDKFGFTLADVKKPMTKKPDTHPVTVAVAAEGKLAEPADAKPFQAVVFGDSDFLANHSLVVGINKDLALNAFAALAQQKDLISIRPKLPKGSMLILTGMMKLALIIFTLAIPVLLFITSAVVWFRRRGA